VNRPAVQRALRVMLALCFAASAPLSMVACATRHAIAPTSESLPLLSVVSGHLSWANITLTMSKSRVEGVIGHSLRLDHDAYAELCGEYYSEVSFQGRNIRIDWSDDTPERRVDAIIVPYGGTERTASDESLRAAAAAILASRVSLSAESSFIALEAEPDEGVNLKSSAEGRFYVTQEACID
jgi:hypothetical protein